MQCCFPITSLELRYTYVICQTRFQAFAYDQVILINNRYCKNHIDMALNECWNWAADNRAAYNPEKAEALWLWGGGMIRPPTIKADSMILRMKGSVPIRGYYVQ
ncbi:hypothetical protein GWI33_003380 [Rhynchophorus ferrugineus]|uniref:Uncharacterized protein n=1 Tax=Rhynchophorus ferrugineus TaxID=354439 RepID=A0A834MPN7_RHYFE|nr:hypothetical protein GWI33_003380 [Rhynchophorus ferrugineus]